MARSEESNKTPIVPCQKGGCISQLFVARPQQQHFHHSLSLTSAGSQNISNVGSLSQHHNMNTSLIRINLSLKEEIKLSRSKNAWQPKVLRRKSDNNNVANAEQELKKVRGVLNKLTSDNFQVLVKSMKDISLDGQENIEKVMLLIFEKTVSEPNFAQIYAKFCHVLFQEIKPDSKKLFNNLLIHRLRTEFENNVNNPNAKNDTLQHITDKLKKTKDPKEKLELTNEYDVEEYKFRRRAWGTVRFIGEMYKLKCLSSDRALLCLESLLDNGNEEKLEYLCKLLITVGPQLDNNGTVERLNSIFHKIQNIVTEAKSDTTKQKVKISSRVRFMLQDVIDLRSRHWDLKPATSNVPTAIRPAAQQHKNNHSSTSNNMNLNNYERVNQRMNYGNNHRQGRNSMHNNNNINESGVSSSGHFVQKSIDIKKLNFSKGVDESSLTNPKLGCPSLYKWRNEAQQSGRNTPTSMGSGAATQKFQNPSYGQQQQQQPQHHSAANGEVKSQSSHTDIQKILNSYSAEDNQKLLNHLIEEYLDCIRSRSSRWQEEIFKTWQKTTQIQQICVIYYILMEYLHLGDVKQLERNACANIFIYIMRFGPFNKKTFARAYEQFAEDFPDLLTDVPNGWSYIFEFLGPILHEGLLTFDDIWSDTWRNEKTFTERFFKALVLHFTKEFGANYMRNMWHIECQSYYKKLFATEQHWRQFVEANKFQFIFDRNVKPEFSKATNTSASSVEQKVQRLETLLNSADNSNLALDYINTNVHVNSAFLKRLTSFLCCDYATTMQAAAAAAATTTTTTARSHTVSNKNSSTCSSSSGSINSGVGGTKSPDLKTPQLNVNLFREKCMPVLRLCLDDHEDHEIICLNAIVESMLQEYDAYSAYNLICNIFDLLYDGELIPKESFDKWYRQWQQQQQEHHQQTADDADAQLQALMQKILL
ncbi:hypothetical protein DOY81_000595 [Sarcophaga bullata]|nr:hypothetical protein DOY81_000595 [Sarcophaga bullata]